MATIYGTNGYDKIVQNNYSAVNIYAYDGDDDIYLNRTDSLGGNNFVDAGYGDDYVLNYFEGGNDIFLGYGDDFYKADARAGISGQFDIVAGGEGYDRFAVNSLESVYKGENGNDTFSSVGFNNTFNGGSGVDTINYLLQDGVSGERGRGVTIDLGTQKASTFTGRLEDLISIENATGTRLGDDNITGSSGANNLKGVGGDDILKGRGGNDVLYGGSGSDDLYGGPDMISSLAAPASITFMAGRARIPSTLTRLVKALSAPIETSLQTSSARNSMSSICVRSMPTN